MSSDPCILAFDTSAAHCAAALLCGGEIRDVRVLEMARGQAEHLFPLLEEVLTGSGLGWADLSALAVGTGPGNFTGIRIAISAARGLALGLSVPAIGITTFEALSEGQEGRFCLPAPRGRRYAQRLADGTAQDDPVLEEGTAPAFDPNQVLPAMARLAARRLGTAHPAPKPLYLRPADAAPPSDPPPVILP